jgi:Ca2+-binding RTX toxin-like protein
MHIYQTLPGGGAEDPGRENNDDRHPGIDGQEDADYDFMGHMVRFENQIAVELGLPEYQRASYQAAIPGGDARITIGHSYTEGQEIDVAILADNEANVIDTSNRTEGVRDLLFGYRGNDVIRAGQGNDFLYGGHDEDQLFGGDGIDTLYGEDGQDWLHGGEGADLLDGGEGNDVVTYVEAGEGVGINLETGLGTAGEALGDRYVSVERFIGSNHSDNFIGAGGNDVFEGGGGQDTFSGGAGTDTIRGGVGHDFAVYDYVTMGGNYGLTRYEDGLRLDRGSGADVDFLFSVEEIRFGSGADVLTLPGLLSGLSHSVVIDGGSALEVRDELDLAQLGGGVFYDNGRLRGSELTFRNFEILTFGAGNDRVRHNVQGAEIYLGDGNDTLLAAATGTEVWGGDGADRFHLQDNVRIMDASAEDRISYAGLFDLTGALRLAISDNQYAMQRSGIVGYAMNGEGDLIIHDFIRNRDMFIANYQSALNGGVDTLGIHVADYQSGAFFAVEDKPSHMNDMNTWALVLGHFMKANLGVSLWEGVDPLVLDLDGDGLELTGISTRGPVFDYDGDGYGERGGWVSRDDGLLVLDANNDGRVADVGELFGGPGLSGFAELAAHDLNADGVIDASDAVYAQLSVWRDLNQNRVVDAGEMLSLSEMGIASIGVGGTASTTSINGNTVTATGGFTRTDGTTGLVGDIGFRVDQQVTTWMGDRTISLAAAALPELKGFGTLTDLRVAMTLDPSLQTVVAAVLPSLDTLDLAVMRDAVLPLFTAWADVSPISGTAPAGAHEDVTVLTEMVDGQRVMTDYAFHRVNVDTGQGEWVMAGSNLARPTLAALLLTVSGDSPAWDVLDGAWIDFFERYMGEALPIGGATVTGAPAMGVQEIFSGLWNQVNLLTVRLAVQGPLAEYFEGVEYDVATDTFLPTTDRQLIPVFEAILAEAGTMSSGALEWLASWDAILDIVVGDYKQPDGVLNTNGFLFANIVAAYESTGLTLDIIDISVALGLPEQVLRAGAGTLTGGDDADLFYLGAGDQTAIGGLGPDTYVMGRGFGHDTIIDIEPPLTEHAEDVVRFADIASTEVTARREGLDLIITVNGTNDELRIVDHFDGRLPGIGGGGDLSSSTGVDFIRFADGVQWTPFDVARAVARHTAGADTLLGTETVDWLDGGAGNDFLSGGNDSDVYVYGHGYGHDTISDLNGHIYLAGPDYVSFIDDITIEDLHFSRDGASNDLLISVAGQDGSLTLINQFAATYTGVFGTYWIDQIEGFLFDDGSSLGWLEVTQLLLQQASTSGDDIIHGFSLEDRIDGGSGNDFMSGGNENDTYVFGAGYDHDTIHEQWSNILSGGIDTVEFTPDTLPEDVAFTRDGDDLIVTMTATGDTLRIRDQYVVTETGTLGTHAFNQVELFRFSNGVVLEWPAIRTAIIEASQTPGNDLVLGTHFDDIFEGGEGDDRIEGGNGGDTYRFGGGDGADTIRDHLDNLFTDRADRVVFGEGISADDIVITRYGAENNSVHMAIGTTGDSVSIEQQFAYTTIALKEFEVERFEFHDGTIWTANDLRLHYLAQVQTSGNDTVIGFWTNDQINGGAGDDILRGGDGSDTYTFDLGFGVDELRENVDNVSYADNDAVVFGAGLLSTDAIFTRDGDDLIISFAGLTDQVTIFGQFETQAFYSGWRDIETFTFGDAVVLTDADIRVLLLAQVSTSGDDVITGFSSVPDVIDGGAGNDTLRGLGGGDTYLFGLGSGQDVIQESIGSLYEDQPDTLRFDATVDRADVTFTRDGADLVITVAGSSDSVRIEQQFGSTGYAAVERFEFDGGLVLTKAEVALLVLAAQSTPGDDIIVGTDGADVIAGGAGNDVLRGGDGADTYYFGAGFGTDVIDENVGNVAISDFDVIEFGPGLLAGDAVLSRDGDDLVISFPSGDSVRILRQFEHQAYFDGWEDIEEIRFAAGEVWTQADIRERLLEQASTSGDDLITGYWGDDVIDGGAGNDDLDGLGGDDTYVFGFGSGHDTVQETASVYEGASDTVAFKVGITTADVAFTRVGDDLVATLTGGADSLTITDFFRLENREVEAFTFADGTSLDRAFVSAAALNAQTTAGDDVVTGSWRGDILAGGQGDDVLSGGAGGDTYHYAAGDGRDIIADGGASTGDTIVLGAGITTATINLYRSGSDLVIETVGGDDHVILVRGQFAGATDRIEGLVFADGTVWDVSQIEAHLEVLPAGELRGSFADDTLTGTSAAETLIGLEGDDVLTGGAGTDVYVYRAGDGSDVIADASTSSVDVDTLQLGDFAPGDVQMRRVGSDLVIIVPGDAITVEGQFAQAGAGRGLERIEFANGVFWTRTDIDAAAWLVGTSGADTLTMSAGDTVFQGGLGDDVLTGGAGSDTYVYASGDGSDQVREGAFAGADRLWLTNLNAADVLLTRVGSDLMVRDLATDQVIEVDNHFTNTGTAESYGIESLRFGGGVIWDRAAISANTWTGGTTGTDNIGGTSGSDNLFGDLGDDILQGGAGGDIYRYRSGDGSDRIEDSSATGADILHLVDLNASDVVLSKVGADLYVKDQATGHSIRINQQITGGGAGNAYGIEIIRFADGTEWNRAAILSNAWIRGTTGNNNFGGTTGDDTMFGDLGSDRLAGGAGADTYVYRSGDGADTIAEDSGVGSDTLYLTDLGSSDVLASRVGSDLMIQDLSTGQSIKVEYHFWSGTSGNGYGIEALKFADGATWTRQQISDAVNGLSAIALSGVKDGTSPLVQPGAPDKDAGPLVQPLSPDEAGKGALDPIVCWIDPNEDFVVKSQYDGPLIRPVVDDTQFHGRFAWDFHHNWQLTLPVDGGVGADTGQPVAHFDDDWLF